MRRLALLLTAGILLAACGRDVAVRLDGADASSAEAGSNEPAREATEPPAAAATASPAPSSPPPADPDEPVSSGATSRPASPRAAQPTADPPVCPECTPAPRPVPEPSTEPTTQPGGLTEPRPGQDHVRPRRWERAEVQADDVTVDVTYWSGVEPCYVLDRVEVREDPDRVVITLYEGSQPGFEGACTEQAVMKTTRVRLSSKLAGRPIVDGAPA